MIEISKRNEIEKILEILYHKGETRGLKQHFDIIKHKIDIQEALSQILEIIK